MALYAFDGTWNTRKDGDDPHYDDTNVVRFFEAYSARSSTNDFYVEGVGTRYEAVGRIIGGLFGAGELPRLNEAYERLCENWANNDRIIDIVGFSRDAATTLDFCHVIHDRGIRRPGTTDVVAANPEIRFLGVWDVVAAFGLGFLGNALLNFGHHLTLPKSGLRYTPSRPSRSTSNASRSFQPGSTAHMRCGSAVRTPISAAATAIAA